MLRKKISIIGTVGIPANYGGFETLAENLTKNLNHKFDFIVFCSSKNFDKKIRTHNDNHFSGKLPRILQE